MSMLAWWQDQVLWCLLDPSPAALVVFVSVHVLVSALLVNMPSTISSSSPFLSLKPDQECGRTNLHSTPGSQSLNGKLSQLNGNGTNGTNGVNGAHELSLIHI